tara:strand:- start:43 stop:486 length:444 start_codon:yes stop_codon:yes gene_type:complete
MARVGSSAGWHGNCVESMDAAKTLTYKDAGKVFMTTDSGDAGYAVTLPTPAKAGAGWTAKFIVNCAIDATLAGDGGDDIVFTPSGDTDLMMVDYIDSDSDVVHSDDNDSVTFDNTAVKGDYLDFFCDGTTFFVYGYSGVAAGITTAT